MDGARLAGHVIVSAAPEVRIVPPVLYRRRGRLFLPNGREVGAGALLKRGAVLHDSKNNITHAGRIRFAELSCGLSGDFPDRVAVGDGGLESGTSAPKIPRDDATVLEHEVARQVVAQRILSEDEIPYSRMLPDGYVLVQPEINHDVATRFSSGYDSATTERMTEQEIRDLIAS